MSLINQIFRKGFRYLKKKNSQQATSGIFLLSCRSYVDNPVAKSLFSLAQSEVQILTPQNQDQKNEFSFHDTK